MSIKNFTKRKEDFTCDVCSTLVKGNGYTNHCPECLHSKHVDEVPGDRAATCQGVMEPVGAFQSHGQWKIRHRCTRCGFERNQSTAPNDSLEQLAKLVNR